MSTRKQVSAAALVLFMFLTISITDAHAGYKENFVKILNLYYGNVCEAKIEGFFTKTLRIDWTSETVLLHTIKVFGDVSSPISRTSIN